jgi:prolyl-tRNA synthetase
LEKEEADEKGITVKKSENFSEWYVQTLIKSEFVDYSDVSGVIVFRPFAYAAWQTVMLAIDKEFKKAGIDDVYFPLFIPEKFLEKEKEHFEGFDPEVAWVTETGKTKLTERLAIRPTSETIMYPSFSRWVRSWRDLPIRYNQWNNVVRWEFKNPVPLLRSREILWNEGHSVFASKEEADSERDVILKIYQKVLKEYLALPGIAGQKTDKEKFAGAIASYSIEHLMPDGWAIQGPDFHSDGQNFAKAFDITFLDKDGKKERVWQNTYAITTRELGVMVATHGDDKGLIIPPKLAYVQIIVVPIYKQENKKVVLDFAKVVSDILSGNFRVKVDSREGYSPGYKFNHWEQKGVPIRIEVGPKEVEKERVVIVRRDTGAKTDTDFGNLSEKIEAILSDINKGLYEKAEKFLKANTHEVEDYEAFKRTIKEKLGMIHAPWCGEQACEDSIRNETGAKITNIPFEQGRLGKKCVYCNKKAKYMVNFAKSY